MWFSWVFGLCMLRQLHVYHVRSADYVGVVLPTMLLDRDSDCRDELVFLRVKLERLTTSKDVSGLCDELVLIDRSELGSGIWICVVLLHRWSTCRIISISVDPLCFACRVLRVLECVEDPEVEEDSIHKGEAVQSSGQAGVNVFFPKPAHQGSFFPASITRALIDLRPFSDFFLHSLAELEFWGTG